MLVLPAISVTPSLNNDTLKKCCYINSSDLQTVFITLPVAIRDGNFDCPSGFFGIIFQLEFLGLLVVLYDPSVVSDALKKLVFDVRPSNGIGAYLKSPFFNGFSLYLHVETNGCDMVEKEQDVLGLNFEFLKEVFNVDPAVGVF